MKIKQITNQSHWQKFFEETGSESFMQSWEWGELQKVEGYEVERVGIYTSSERNESRGSRQARTLIATAQIVKIRSKRGDFIFVPHGPLVIQNSKFRIQNLIKNLKNYLVEIAKKENFSFIRVTPALNDVEEIRKTFSDVGFRYAPTYMSAESLWVLPLDRSEDELLANMRKTTRYLIRKAQRDGVVIEKRTDEKAVDDFYKLYEKTVERENFVPFSKKMILEEFRAFNKTENALFLFAKINKPVRTIHELSLQNNDYLAAALIIFTKSTAFYHQGASIHSKVPAPYLLQWEAIKEAKKRGCKLYSFWGVYRPGRTPKAWQGLTLFKQGFGGRQIDYILPQDYIISKKYYLTYLYEKFLNWKRGV